MNVLVKVVRELIKYSWNATEPWLSVIKKLVFQQTVNTMKSYTELKSKNISEMLTV